MWLEIYPGKVENIALFSHLNRGKCWSCIRTILVLLWRYFKTSDSKFCAESSAKLFYCQTSTIPARYFGIYLGGILLQICCLCNAQLSLNEAKYCPLTIVNDVHMFFSLFCHKWPFCFIMHRFLNDKCSCYSDLFSSSNNLVLLSAILRHFNWNTTQNSKSISTSEALETEIELAWILRFILSFRQCNNLGIVPSTVHAPS